MTKTLTGYVAIFKNEDGSFSPSNKLAVSAEEAIRGIAIFEGRVFCGIAPVTFEYDPESDVCGMEYRLDNKPPCRG